MGGLFCSLAPQNLYRCVVGPRPDIDWNQPWHTILHAWHNRIHQQLTFHGSGIWSAKSLFGNYSAPLHETRWVKRILLWNPGCGRPGRSFFQWQTPIQIYFGWHHFGDALNFAEDTGRWFQYHNHRFCSPCSVKMLSSYLPVLFSKYLRIVSFFAFHLLCP